MGIAGINGGTPQRDRPTVNKGPTTQPSYPPGAKQDIEDLMNALKEGSKTGMIEALDKLQHDDPTSHASGMIPIVEKYGSNTNVDDGITNLLMGYVSYYMGTHGNP